MTHKREKLADRLVETFVAELREENNGKPKEIEMIEEIIADAMHAYYDRLEELEVEMGKCCSSVVKELLSKEYEMVRAEHTRFSCFRTIFRRLIKRVPVMPIGFYKGRSCMDVPEDHFGKMEQCGMMWVPEMREVLLYRTFLKEYACKTDANPDEVDDE